MGKKKKTDSPQNRNECMGSFQTKSNAEPTKPPKKGKKGNIRNSSVSIQITPLLAATPHPRKKIWEITKVFYDVPNAGCGAKAVERSATRAATRSDKRAENLVMIAIGERER